MGFKSQLLVIAAVGYGLWNYTEILDPWKVKLEVWDKQYDQFVEDNFSVYAKKKGDSFSMPDISARLSDSEHAIYQDLVQNKERVSDFYAQYCGGKKHEVFDADNLEVICNAAQKYVK